MVEIEKIKDWGSVWSSTNLGFDYLPISAGVSSLGVPGVPWNPQILADQFDS